MYYQVIIVVHVLLGLSVIGFVLIQQGKGADAGAAFGSASSGSVFGAQGASSFLSRTTAILAALFFSTSLGLAVLSGNLGGEVDLMSEPEIEDVIADVPLVNGAAIAPSPVSETVPVIQSDVPAEVVEKLSTVVSTVEKGVESSVETIETEVDVVVEDTKTAVTEVLETEVVTE
ncbi:MAG: preprotein translocase subunit SecG [Methylococcaceae bacterium]